MKSIYDHTRAAFETAIEDNVLSDYLTTKVSSFPQGQHMFSWQVAQMLPFFLDLCAETEGTKCHMGDYFEWCLMEQQDIIKTKTDMTQN